MIVWSTWTRTLVLFMAVFLSACVILPTSQNSNSGRYEMENDSGELEPIDLSQVQTVTPVVENRTLAGNKSPYTINGRTYTVMESEEGYQETGIASWYGRKFHGHLTSNGEVYDMFKMSAAHTRLPIPSYIRVTNLDNGKSIVARVNDRGPFHEGRIVDLSYAAASMLDYADKGTARVRVEALVPESGNQAVTTASNQNAQASNQSTAAQVVVFATIALEDVATERQRIDSGQGQEYLQIGAFSNIDSAQSLLLKVASLTNLPVFIRSDSTAGNDTLLHRVRLGPLNETMNIESIIRLITAANLASPFRVRQ